jgi:hypothetical protein
MELFEPITQQLTQQSGDFLQKGQFRIALSAFQPLRLILR